MPTIVSCPTCGKKVEWAEKNKFRPFCSDRCKQIDLGAWAEEKYVIPSKNPVDDVPDDMDNDSPREQ
jgi:endogenous inhibitor of DNA gyrase (YacG/DUF329 family)